MFMGCGAKGGLRRGKGSSGACLAFSFTVVCYVKAVHPVVNAMAQVVNAAQVQAASLLVFDRSQREDYDFSDRPTNVRATMPIISRRLASLTTLCIFNAVLFLLCVTTVEPFVPTINLKLNPSNVRTVPFAPPLRASNDDDGSDDSSGPSDSEIEAFRKKLEGMSDSSSPPPSPPPPSTNVPIDDSTPTTIPSFAPSTSSPPPYFSTPLIPATTGTSNFKLLPGQILLAKPEIFCSPSAPQSLLQKYGLTTSLPPELGPDRIADLLPVILLTEVNLFGISGVLLNRRTGYLLGDLQQPHANLNGFMIQPLWFGGTSGGSGMNMVHLKGEGVKGSESLGGGMFWGGSLEVANDMVVGGDGSGFDFKFFVQSTRWMPKQLEGEVEKGMWMAAEVDKRVVFKSRDRQGGKRAKPLWTEVMGLCGEKDDYYQSILDEVYKGEL
ncbi:hypothetical protein TrST_g6405 [Triparma strigata]|uniref:Uncharacterized protein n=1 Tax=Triparma strigata TaxID=1606541 RepID=A0A9W7EXQ8_9STRA|nr:hypothetical protein TrST_g6405 [Triparma strigata]